MLLLREKLHHQLIVVYLDMVSFSGRSFPSGVWERAFINMEKDIQQAGSGPRANPGDTITVHCTGYIRATSKKFWSTKDPGQKPFTFNVGLGQVIQGWDEGCLTMCKGEKARLTIPYSMGYGEGGFPAWGIPPKADLIFDIEILDIKRKM